MRFQSVAVAVLGMGTALAAAQSGAQWDYAGKTGPLVWGKLDPAYKACGSGHEQSPIDIHGAHLNKALAPLEFHYMAATATVMNDGHTIAVDVAPGSYLVTGGERYNLKKLEFHHPSETPVKGKLTEMDVELVHQSAEGKTAILEIRLAQQLGEPNAVLATLWQHIPKQAGTSEKTTEVVNPGGLLPAERGYWTYTGSLTRPPCTEGVRWIVMEDAVSVSREQVRALLYVYSRANSRTVQDAHGRRIEAHE